MTKDEFDKKYVGNGIRVHCPTKSLNREFISLVNNFGYRVTDNWNDEKGETCYSVLWNKYGSVDSYLLRGCNIVEFKSLKGENMKDLRDLLEIGRVVEARDGYMGFVLKDKIIYSIGWNDLKSLNTELKCETFKNMDVVRVYDSPIVNGLSWSFSALNKDLLNLVWERKEFEVTDDEKIILKNIDKIYNYIARDADGDLCVYNLKPNKSVKLDIWITYDSELYIGITTYNHLFQFIKWEDNEPVLIADLLK